MKCGFATKFKNGELTYFKEKIQAGFLEHWEELDIPPGQIENVLGFSTSNEDVRDGKFEKKIHTIRAGSRWRTGMTIHMVTGDRTKNYDCFAQVRVKSVQKIDFTFGHERHNMIVCIGGQRVDLKTLGIIAQNDGLSKAQFIDWFFKQSVEIEGKTNGSAMKFFEGQIIHWTDLNY